MSFQDLTKINAAYKELNNKYDVHGILRHPYGRLKTSFWDVLERLIRQRHALIHQAELDVDYKPDQLKRDIDLVYKALWRVYQEMVKLNNWQPVGQWEF
jgi:hypothetical protein